MVAIGVTVLIVLLLVLVVYGTGVSDQIKEKFKTHDWLDDVSYKLQCPDCKEGFLCGGPQGGMCENMICSKCGAWFNLAQVADQHLIVNRKDESGKLIDGNFEEVQQVRV